MPYGVECDQYSILGEILEYRKVVNQITGVELYQVRLDVNELIFDVYSCNVFLLQLFFCNKIATQCCSIVLKKVIITLFFQIMKLACFLLNIKITNIFHC